MFMMNLKKFWIDDIDPQPEKLFFTYKYMNKT